MTSPSFVRALVASVLLSAACGRATSGRASPPDDAGSDGEAGATATGGAGGGTATGGAGGAGTTGGSAGGLASFRVTGSIDAFDSARVANDEHVVTRQTLLAFKKACSREHCVTGSIRP